MAQRVDLETCAIPQDKGDAQLQGAWTDPEFDPTQNAFYYARVLGESDLPLVDVGCAARRRRAESELPKTIQERAYTSPIWFIPDAWPLTRCIATSSLREPLVQFLAVALILFAANRLIHGSAQRMADDQIDDIGRSRAADRRQLPTARRTHCPAARSCMRSSTTSSTRRSAIAKPSPWGSTPTTPSSAAACARSWNSWRRMPRRANNRASNNCWRHLQSHAAVYRLPERVSLRQILASADARGAKATADAVAFLDELRSGADAAKLGDASMLPPTLPLTTQQGIAMSVRRRRLPRMFSSTVVMAGSARSTRRLERTWYRSYRGSRRRDPTLDEVRDKLRSDWIEARRRAKRAEFQASLRGRYQISVDWPEPYASQPAAASVVSIERPLDTIDTHGE